MRVRLVCIQNARRRAARPLMPDPVHHVQVIPADRMIIDAVIDACQDRLGAVVQTPSIAICGDGELQGGRTQSSSSTSLEAMEEESFGIKFLPSWSRTSTIQARMSGMSISYHSQCPSFESYLHWSPSTPQRFRFNRNPGFSRKSLASSNILKRYTWLVLMEKV